MFLNHVHPILKIFAHTGTRTFVEFDKTVVSGGKKKQILITIHLSKTILSKNKGIRVDSSAKKESELVSPHIIFCDAIHPNPFTAILLYGSENNFQTWVTSYWVRRHRDSFKDVTLTNPENKVELLFAQNCRFQFRVSYRTAWI